MIQNCDLCGLNTICGSSAFLGLRTDYVGYCSLSRLGYLVGDDHENGPASSSSLYATLHCVDTEEAF
eukprot:scaffold238073_cov64-Attheya_sp.AAC.1